MSQNFRVLTVLVVLAICAPVALFGQNPDFRITELPGGAVPLPTDGFSVRQINGLWHGGSYYVYADVIDWDNPEHPDSYGSSIGAYSSPNGVDWTYHGLVVSPGASGEWDHGGVATPGAVKFKNKFYVTYSGREFDNGLGERFLGLAVADNPLGPFTKSPDPIVSLTGFPDPDQPACFDDPQLVAAPGDDELLLYYRYARWTQREWEDPSQAGCHDYSVRLQTTTDPEQGWSAPQIIINTPPGNVNEPVEAKWIDGQFVLGVLDYRPDTALYVSADGVNYTRTTLPNLSDHVSVFLPNPAASLSGLLVDGNYQGRFVNTAGYTDGQGHFTQWISPIETTNGYVLPPDFQAGLLVSNTAGNTAMDAIALSGEVAGNLTANPGLGNDRAVRIGPDGNLYVASHNGLSVADPPTVQKYDFSAESWSTFAIKPDGPDGDTDPDPFIPVGMTFAADGNLYVSSLGTLSGSDGTIEKFDGTTGAWISTIVTGLGLPRGLESAGGNLYLADGTIKEYSTAGALLDGAWGSPSAANPRGLAIGPNGNLYAAVIGTAGPDGTIEEFDITTGGVAINTYSDANLNIALDVAFDDAGFVYVTDVANDNVQRFTVATGVYDGSFSFAVTNPDGIAFADLPHFTWNVDSSGDWNDQSNWSPSRVPSGNGTIVLLGSAFAVPRTVFTDSTITLTSIRFDNVNRITVAGSGAMNLESDAGKASINVLQGSHQFQAVINLLSPTDVDVSDSASLTFNNVLNLGGNTLTKTGAGTMTINNVLITGGGVLNASAGVVSGGGTLEGDLNNSSAILAPGNSPGTFSVTGNYTQGPSGRLLIEIGGLTQGITYDSLDITGEMIINGGALEVALLNGFTPRAGDMFDVLDFSSFHGAGFETLILDSLSTGLAWDTSQLLVDGFLAVVAVPEPSSVALLVGFGLIGLVGGIRQH